MLRIVVSTFRSCARTAPALVLSEMSRLPVSPRPNAAVLDDDAAVDAFEDEVDDVLLVLALVMTPGAMPSRPSASLSAGPEMNVNVVPGLAATFRPSPSLP